VEGADFSGADLRGADFRGASLFGASFCSQAPANSPTAALAARLDATTLVDPAALEHLTPLQAEYIGRFAT
jgi:uncharacterized protein YjbI with pentapeptide repeats